ncbi:MAG: HAD-IB family hydrolase [Betaproteobacteria bacterium]|nr:HAD-IB family hydrolase [Betaproteobacteria bacterium]
MSDITWAAFDFDGTLTRRDTLLPFLRFGFGFPRVALALGLEAPTLIGFAARLVANDHAKRRVLRRVLGGAERAALVDLGERYADAIGPRRLRADMMQRLRQHQHAGHRCVLVTASPAIYTRPWARRMGFAHVIATELEFDATQRATGEFVDGNCWGPEKARRLRALLGPQELRFAYGDSRGDREMLAMARQGRRVDRRSLEPLDMLGP